MEAQKTKQLNKVENALFIIIALATATDIVSGRVHSIIFGISTAVLALGILGIISIELIKLQIRQKQRH